jgi:hypothetical protein
VTADTELEALRAKLAALEAERATTAAATSPHEHHRWRSVASATLIIIACVLAPVSVTAVWANRQISDTDRYVETISPLADDAVIQAAVADEITQAVLENIDVPTITSDAIDGLSQLDLAPRAVAGLKALEVPITNGIESFIGSSVAKIVASDQFAAAWDQANRVAHSQVVDLLSGKQGGAISAQNDQITLNLGAIIAQVRQDLIDAGYSAAEKIPPIDKSFVLVTSDAVTKAQGVYSLLDTLGYWLPIITFLLLGLGVYVAREHRRALIAGSLGFVVGMLLIGIGLQVARIMYLDAVPTDVLPRDAAGDIFDTLVRFLRSGLRAVAVLGLVMALGAFFTGRSTTAVRTRAMFAHGLGGIREGAEAHGVQTGAVGRWTFAHKHALWIALAILGGFTLTFWSRPTAGVVLTTALVVLVLAGLVELVARPPDEVQPATGSVAASGALVPSPRAPTELSEPAARDQDEAGVPRQL